MIKKIIAVAMLVLLLLGLCGCGEKKILHCDACGKEIKFAADSNVTEDWILLCPSCAKKLDQ